MNGESKPRIEAQSPKVVRHFNGTRWVFQVALDNTGRLLRNAAGSIRSFKTREAALKVLKKKSTAQLDVEIAEALTSSGD